MRLKRPAAIGQKSAFLAPLGLILASALAAYLFVWIVDPYELRWARHGERLGPHAYPEDVTPRLVPAAAADGVDIVIVGGSTAIGYTPTMMQRAFPEAQRPFNLAYPCATADDLALILPRLETSRRLKRVIISLDFSLMWHCLSVDSPLDARYFAPSWSDPTPEFSVRAVELSFRVLRTGVLDLPEWRQRSADRVDGADFAPALTTQPGKIAEIARQVGANRGAVFRGAPTTCAGVPVLSSVILPSVRRLARRGVAIDLLAPPYSLAYYFDAPSNFPRLMAIRRCALEMSASIPGVRFHSFDTDLPIVGDLALYSDVGHIRDYATYDRILRSIAVGDRVVRPGKWGPVETQLNSELASFAPKS
jgi:hypothetical protein